MAFSAYTSGSLPESAAMAASLACEQARAACSSTEAWRFPTSIADLRHLSQSSRESSPASTFARIAASFSSKRARKAEKTSCASVSACR